MSTGAPKSELVFLCFPLRLAIGNFCLPFSRNRNPSNQNICKKMQQIRSRKERNKKVKGKREMSIISKVPILKLNRGKMKENDTERENRFG